MSEGNARQMGDIRHSYAATGPGDYVQRAAHFDAVLAGWALSQVSEEQVVKAVMEAQQDDSWAGMNVEGARRVWHYLTQPADPREGEKRQVPCCPGKSCSDVTVVRRAGTWLRTANGEVWHDPEEA